MFYLFDNDEKLIQIIDRDRVQEATRSESINTAATLETVVKTEPAAEAKYIAHKDILNKNQINLYKITLRRDTGQGRSITGIESAYDDLLADGYIRDIRPTNQATRVTLTTILQGSRWEPGTVEVSKTISTNFYYKSRLLALQEIIALTGGEVRFRIEFNGREITARYVDILGRLGKDRGKRYAHGSNLLNVVREEQSANIATALVGRGKGEQVGDGYGRSIMFTDIEWSKSNGNPVDKPAGQEFVEIPEATVAYGYPNGNPRIDIAEFSEIEDKEELLQATYDLLVTSCRPLVSYEADVKDIGDTGLGDTVGIRRQDLGIAYKTRIHSRTINLLNTADIKVQLGDEIQDFRTNQINRVKEQVRKAEIEATSKIELVREEARAAGSNLDAYKYELRRDNEYGLPPGTYHFNKPIDQNPTFASWETAGYEYKSNSKNPDGSWNWTTIATPDGYIADNMFAGKISADLVELKSNETLVDKIDQINLSNESTQTQLANLMNKDVISPLEKANIETLITRINIETANIKTALSDSDYDVIALATALSNLVNYLNDIVAAEGYSEIETDQFNVLFSDYLAEYQAALNEVEGITQSRITEITSGQIMLGDRIGAYEEQLQLTPELISMLVNRGNGLERAMTLGQEEIAFYLNEIKKVWLGLNGLNADNATINNSLQTGNHIIEKIGTEFTSWRPI